MLIVQKKVKRDFKVDRLSSYCRVVRDPHKIIATEVLKERTRLGWALGKEVCKTAGQQLAQGQAARKVVRQRTQC